MSLLYSLFLFLVVWIRIELLGLWRIYVVFFVHFLHNHSVWLIHLVVLLEVKDFYGMLVLKLQEEKGFGEKKFIKRYMCRIVTNMGYRM